jgi:HPt (histidine-containing phosphotransfer) domain-containing protein
MSLKNLKDGLESLRSLYSSGKEKGGESFRETVLKKLKNISGIAKSADWQSIDDVCQVGDDLIKKTSSGDISDDQKAYQHFESLLKVFDDLYSDIESNGQSTISVKGQLARVKMFIGDFANVSEEPKDTESEDEGHVSVDVIHELTGRVESMEQLVLGIKGLHIEPDAINGLFREFHTLKGEAGFLGFENLGKFCHRVETILEPLRGKKVLVSQEIIDILLFCVDKTKLLIMNVQNKEDTVDNGEINEKLSALEKIILEMGDKQTETLQQAEGDPERYHPNG